MKLRRGGISVPRHRCTRWCKALAAIAAIPEAQGSIEAPALLARNVNMMWLIAIFAMTAAHCAGAFPVSVSNEHELRAALLEPAVTTAILKADVKLGAWAELSRIRISRNLTVTASDEYLTRRIYPSIDWQSILGMLELAPSAMLTFRGLEFENFTQSVGFTLMFLQSSPGAVIVAEVCHGGSGQSGNEWEMCIKQATNISLRLCVLCFAWACRIH